MLQLQVEDHRAVESQRLRSEAEQLRKEAARLRAEADRLRTEIRALRSENLKLRTARDGTTGSVARGAGGCEMELTAGTSIGPRRPFGRRRGE